MQSFIVEHYLNKVVDVYCGGPDVFRGNIEACADNVLTLEKDGKHTHIAIDKVIAIWAQ
ncbi:MM0924 family protein [Methanosarcina sp. Mfa9]|uniref:MM0924 family protein n=1 Tax=Methanosarcina sp. Mfa9 TaxID=3439063 RepID=UPI003F838642